MREDKKKDDLRGENADSSSGGEGENGGVQAGLTVSVKPTAQAELVRRPGKNRRLRGRDLSLAGVEGGGQGHSPLGRTGRGGPSKKEDPDMFERREG